MYQVKFKNILLLYDDWSTIPLFHCFLIASRIACHKFIELKRYLHFTDNNNVIPRGKDGYDKLAKIRSVLTAVQQTCVHNYSPLNKDDRDQTELDRMHKSIKIEIQFYDVNVGSPTYATYPVGKIVHLYPNVAWLLGCTYTAPLSLAMEVMLTAYYTDG